MDSSNDWIFPREFIDNPRGENPDGNRISKERDDRSRTIWFMEDLSKALHMERRVLSTASVYFHRFFLFHSFERQNRFHVAVACLFLAGKVEERAFKLKDLVHGYFVVRWPHNQRPDETKMKEMQKSVILAERLILQALNFDLNVMQPYSYLQTKMKEWKNYTTDESRRALLQTAVNFMNDSFRSTFCLEYRPSEIGAASLYLATVALSMTPITTSSNNRAPAIATPELSWIDLLVKDVEEYRLKCLCLEIMEMYEKLAFIINEHNGGVSSSERERVTRKLIEQMGGSIPEHISISAGDRMDIDDDLSPTSTAEQYGDATTDSALGMDRELQPRRVTVTKFLPTGSLSVSRPSAEKTPQGNESLTMSIGGSEDAYADDTPVYSHHSTNDDTPSNTPRFSDLARCGSRKERSNSMGDSSVDYKRIRTE